MTRQALELLQKALSLSDDERAALAGSLLDSLDTAVDEGAEDAWNQEIARRIADLDSGKAKTFPWEELRARISSRLAHGQQES
jgi:putative addiction module component (TIGR02574 family)